MTSTRPRPAIAAVAALVIIALAGCSSAVPMTAADDATNPDCASIMVRLPEVVAELDQRETDAQATSAWGSPASVLLSCGVPVPAPSTQRCATVDGVDWLIDDSDESRGVFITYGRDPAVQVVVDAATSESTVLNELSDAVKVNPATRACTAPEDATTGDDPVIEGE